MYNDNFKKWLNEKEDIKKKNFYVLIGPPAVGKTSWIENNIATGDQTYMVISRDQIIEDQIFPNYKLSNNELYTIYPPKSADVGKKIEGMEKYGKVILDKRGKKVFENILRANSEVESLIAKEIDVALSKEGPQNIVIDAINGTPEQRKTILNLVEDKPEYKKIAVYFEFAPYKDEIKKRAAERASQMKKNLAIPLQEKYQMKCTRGFFLGS